MKNYIFCAILNPIKQKGGSYMSRDMGAIDKNLKVETILKETDIIFYDARNAPFRIYGLIDPSLVPFRRLPAELADNVNYQVSILSTNTSGARVRFRTDSEYVAIKAVMPTITHFPHMPLTGSTGFDLYLCKNGVQTYFKTFVPPIGIIDGFESVLHFGSSEERDIIINFPLYNDLSELYIGLQDGSTLSEGSKYRYQKPILYYGSSITQGGCASRPGNCYQSIISRRLDTDFLNFGYSSGGCGEENMMDYLAQQDISAFVMDYDYNSYSQDHLAQSHPRALQIIRKHKPELPVIMITKPDIRMDNEDDIKRRDIIFSTYANALAAGDRNVYFIDGYSLFGGEGWDSCTVDGAHPNDLGFWRMADVIGSTLSRILIK